MPKKNAKPIPETSPEPDSADRPLSKEASAAKMRAAQTGGASVGLGPSEMEQQQIKQRDTSQPQTAAQGAQQAAQAQAQQTSPTPPAAPAGPTGVMEPYPAQNAPEPPPSATAGLPGPEADSSEPDDQEQGPPTPQLGGHLASVNA
jgi:hypothetical protein